MDSTTGDPTLSASSVPAAPAGRLPARQAATSLAGLIDVLDRMDGPAGSLGRRRLAAHRSASPAAGSRSTGSRSTGFRATATRSVPLRSVQPAPMARRPAAAPAVEPGSYWDMTRPPVPAAPADSNRKLLRPPTRRAALIRRAAMWGAGPDGEYLAWRTGMAAPVPAQPAGDVALRIPRLRSLVRRMALWGAGDNGVNLAWRPRATSAPARRLDPPVVLREMPSTPLIQPAEPAPAGRRPIGPVLPRVAPIEPVGWCAAADSGPPAVSGWPAPPTGWPQPPEWPPPTPAVTPSMPAVPRSSAPAPSGRTASSPPTFPTARFSFPSPRERGLARARGDPLCAPARGSPPVRRRPSSPTPSASVWSPAAALPPPCPAHAAPG